MGRTACTEPQCLYSRARPLLPLWAVRSVQSLSACTVELYLYSPYGPYGLYRASVHYEGNLYLFLHILYVYIYVNINFVLKFLLYIPAVLFWDLFNLFDKGPKEPKHLGD
jgi:hypothetical protein